MPLIHQENCAFSSFDYPKLETSIEKLSETAIKHMSETVQGSDENFRRHRKKPLSSSTSMNHHPINNTAIKTKVLKIVANAQALKRAKKRDSTSPLKSPSPPTKINGKRSGSIINNSSMNVNMDCLPSTSHSTSSKSVKDKKIKMHRLPVKTMFNNSRPVILEYKDDKSDSSIPPFVKNHELVESEEEDEVYDMKKQKMKSDTPSASKSEYYDAAPIRDLRRGFQYKTEKEAYCLESTTKWFARWNEPIQVEDKTVKNQKNALLYESAFTTTFKNLIIPRKYKIPNNLVKRNNSEVTTISNPSESKIYSYAYKMDEMDLGYLDIENCQRLLNGKMPINSSAFSHIIDTFEVDCYITIWKLLLEQIAASRRFFDDPQHAACDICYAEECESEDNIMFCEGCQTVVHQCCYGIDNLPSDSWLCDVCLIDSDSPACLLCPLHNGAMKKDSCNNGFVHLSCALWIPEVTFEDADHRENIIISKVKDNRFTAVCEVCGLVKGACLFCSDENCNAAYHVTCGQRAGYMFKMESEPILQFISYCNTHTLQRLPPNTLVINKYVRSMPMKNAKDLEQFFASYTDFPNEKLGKEYGNEVVGSVFDYWKLKRLDKGSPLILPSDIPNSMIPQLKDVAIKANEVKLRKEPRDTRMAADNMRTLLWMTSERETRKLEILQNSQSLLNSIMNDVQSGKLPEDEIDNAVKLISDMTMGEFDENVDMEVDDDGVIECPILGSHLDAKLLAENYVTKNKAKTVKAITSFRSKAIDSELEDQFDGLDFEDGDEDSPPDVSDPEIYDEDEESDGVKIFVNQQGANFRGTSAGKPTSKRDEKIVKPQEIVALICNP